MAQQAFKNRLVNFTTLQSKQGGFQQKKCYHQAYNSLMLSMSELDSYQQVDDFTQCENQSCRMILTSLDKDYIDDWNWVVSNRKNYEDVQDKIKIMEQNKYNWYIWNCRFCATKNFVQRDKINFANNKTKVVIRDALAKTQDKKLMNSQSPLLLFLIDNSSSMDEQIIQTDKIKQNKQIYTFVNDVLKKTQIYQKISQNQKKMLNQVKKNFDDVRSQTYVDSLTKHRVLMSMTQKITLQICSSKSRNQKHKLSSQRQSERKIGFMFFNSDVVLQKIPRKGETKVIKISNKQFYNQKNKNGQMYTNFESFNDLYQLGKQNRQNYGMNIIDFKFTDIDLTNVSPTGQTALGPALAIASGIVSGYGPGSLIVIITDGRANKGIFNECEPYEEQITMLRLKLNQSKSQTCLIRLQSKLQNKKQQTQSCLQRFFRKYSSVINISLSKKDPLQDMKKNLTMIIEKSISSKTWTNNIQIKCQNPNVIFKEHSIDRMKKKLFKSHQIQFITPQIRQKDLTAFDYRHPFMTQVLIEYQNIETKKQCKFMAFLIQKIIKYNQMNKKDQQSFNSTQTLQNILSFLEVEGQKLDMLNIPLSLSQQSFRGTMMQSFKFSMHRQFQKQVMKESFLFEPPEKQEFKNPKQYIKSLTQKKNQYDDQYIYKL